MSGRILSATLSFMAFWALTSASPLSLPSLPSPPGSQSFSPNHPETSIDSSLRTRDTPHFWCNGVQSQYICPTGQTLVPIDQYACDQIATSGRIADVKPPTTGQTSITCSWSNTHTSNGIAGSSQQVAAAASAAAAAAAAAEGPPPSTRTISSSSTSRVLATPVPPTSTTYSYSYPLSSTATTSSTTSTTSTALSIPTQTPTTFSIAIKTPTAASTPTSTPTSTAADQVHLTCNRQQGGGSSNWALACTIDN